MTEMTKNEIYTYVVNNPGATKRDIAYHFHCHTSALIRPMSELEENGFLRVETFQDGGEGAAFRRLKYFSKRG